MARAVWTGTDYKTPLLIKVWDGGLNTKAQATELPLNQSPSLSNVWTDDYGAIETIPGYVTFASGLGSAPIDGIHSFAPVIGSPYLLAVCGGSLFYSTAQSATTAATFASVPSALSLFTSGSDVRFLTTDGKALMVNGNVYAYKWDGTVFTRYGVTAPTANLSMASGAAGVLSGTFTYWLTMVNTAGVEGNYALASNSFAVASKQIALGGIPTAPLSYGVNSYNLYRNTAGAAGIPWKVTSISNGVTAYTDNVADSALVAAAPTDNGVMPKVKYVVDANGYLFASGDANNPQRIYWSKQGQREVWPALNFLDVGKGDGYPITGLSVFGTTVAIHKNDGFGNGRIWILYMPDTTGLSDPTNWSLMGTPCYFSTQSDKTIIFANHLAYYLAKTGWYAFTGQDLAQSAADGTIGKFSVDSQSFDIEPDILTLNNSALPKAAAINFQNKIFIAVPSGSTQTTNNKIYIYDYMIATQPDHTKGSWFPISAPTVNCMVNHAGMLVAGSSANDGQVYQLLTGLDNAGSPIDSYYYTPEITGDEKHRDSTKVWRFIDITYANTAAILNVTYINDAKNEAGQSDTINMAGTATYWGTSVWGAGTWNSGANRSTTRLVLRASVSKKIQFKFEVFATDAHFKIHDITLRYTIKGAR
jgi:hypothetical protein